MSKINNKSLKKSENKENEKILDLKEYQISANNSDYTLKVEIDNKYIHFSLYEINKIFNYIFRNKFELSQIISKLNLVQTKYTSLSKIIKFIDKAYSKNKIFIEQNSENEMSLIFEVPVDYEVGKYSLKLKKRNLEDKELLPILIEQINRLNNNNIIVKNKFNEIEKQINSISRKNTINRASEGSDINEEINIIKQQLNDINMKLTGGKTYNTFPKTRNNFDKISAIKSSISKNAENDYNNTYKSQKRKKNELFDEKEDDKYIYEKDKNKNIYSNERYYNNNEEESDEEKHLKDNKKILNKNKSNEKIKNGSKDEYRETKKSLRKSQKESNDLKKSKNYRDNDDYKEDKKDESESDKDKDNSSNNDIRNSKKIMLRSQQPNKRENSNNKKEKIYILPKSPDNSLVKDINLKHGKQFINNNPILNNNKNDNLNQSKENNNSKLSHSKENNIKNNNNNNLSDENKENKNSKIINQSGNTQIENGIIKPNKITYIQKNKNEIEDYENKTKYLYHSSPIKFKYKMDICSNNTSCGWNDMFEIYISYRDNKEYLASPDNNNFNINIISLINNKLETSLEGHNNRVRAIRYFINEYKNNNNENENDINNDSKIIYEYLISADDNHIIIVWDLLNNYEIRQKVDTNYEDDIYSCLIFFNNEDINQNYIISSTYSTSNDIQNSATKIYSLETGKYLFHIKESNYDNIYYLLLWLNKENNTYYLIQFSYKKIIINSLDPKNNEPYAKLVNEPENEHYSGFIYSKNNTEYLCTSCYNGFIHVWDLYSKKIVNVIDTKCILCHIIQWSEQYVIVADFENKTFIIVNLDKKEIYNDISVKHTMEVKCVKKFLHPKYGECLLTAGRDKTIKLWKI